MRILKIMSVGKFNIDKAFFFFLNTSFSSRSMLFPVEILLWRWPDHLCYFHIGQSFFVHWSFFYLDSILLHFPHPPSLFSEFNGKKYKFKQKYKSTRLFLAKSHIYVQKINWSYQPQKFCTGAPTPVCHRNIHSHACPKKDRTKDSFL